MVLPYTRLTFPHRALNTITIYNREHSAFSPCCCFLVIIIIINEDDYHHHHLI